MTPIANLPEQLMNLLREHLSHEDIGMIADEYGERSGHKGSLYDQLIDRTGVQQVVRLLVLRAVARKDVMGLVRIVFEYRADLQQIIHASGFEQSSLIQTYLRILQDEVDSFKKNVAELPNLRYMIKEADVPWAEVQPERFLSRDPRVVLLGATRLERSTALFRLAEHLSTDWQASDPARPFPVFADLGRWFNPKMSLMQFLQAQMSWAGVPQLAEQLPDLMHSGQVVLLLDGLHELPYFKTTDLLDPRVWAIVSWSLAKEWGKVKCMLSRQLEDPLIGSQWTNLYVLDSSFEGVPALIDAPVQQLKTHIDIDKTIEHEVTAGQMTAAEAVELQIRLSYLALNMTYPGEKRRYLNFLPGKRDGVEKHLAAAWLFHLREIERSDQSEYHEPEASPAEQQQVVRLLQLAEAAGLLVLDKENVRFADQYIQDYFCIYYCLAQPPDDPQFLDRVSNYEFRDIWRLWEEFDPTLIDKLLVLLKHPDNSGLRRNAAWALKWLGDIRAVEPLIDALSDEDENVRMSASIALGSLGDHRAVEPLIATLKNDTNPLVRESATRALGDIEDERRIEALLEALNDGNVYRSTIASVLAKIHDERLIEPLVALLADNATNAYMSAKKALVAYGKDAVPALMVALTDLNVGKQYKKDDFPGLGRGDVSYNAAEVLGEIGDIRPLPLLLWLIEHDSEVGESHMGGKVRHAAERAVKKIQTQHQTWHQAAAPLVAAINSEDRTMSIAAAFALGLLEDHRAPRAVEPLLDALHDEDARVRWGAAKLLGRIGDPTPLIAALHDKDSYVRATAASILGTLGDRRAVEPLIAALADENSRVRWQVICALGTLGDNPAVEPLIAALQNENDEVRLHAVQVLGSIGSRSAVEPLIAALADQDSRIRQAAVEALGKLGDKRALPALLEAATDSDREVRQSVGRAVYSIDPNRSVEILIIALQDEDREVRFEATRNLIQLGDSRAVEPLIEALKDEYSPVREYAADALGKHRDSRAVEALIENLQDKTFAGWAAAGALGDIGDNRAIEPLIAMLESVEIRERCSPAAGALAKFGERAVPALLAALKDEGPGEAFYSRDLWEPGSYNRKFVDNLINKAHLRYYTAEVLGKVGDVRALPVLMWMAAKDENQTIYGINKVRDSAAQAIESIKLRYEDTDLLVAALNDQDHLARVGAAFALSMLKDERATEVLSTALAEKDRRVRWGAAGLLGNFGGEEAIAALINALDDEDADVGRSAVAALVKIGEAAIQSLLTALKEENSNMHSWNWFAWIASTLSEIGEAALQPLIAALKDQDDFVRYWAANALGNIGNKQAVDALNMALENDEPLVRLSVAAALTKLGDDKAIELLIMALKNEDENIRYFAVLNLRGTGDSRATEALNTMLEDRDDFMRSEAISAVGKVGASRDALLRGVLLDEARKLGAAEREFLREGSTFEGTMEETRLEGARTVRYAIGKLQGCLLRFLVVLELPLIVRFVLQFLGADSSNIFTAVLYAITGVILFPFHGVLKTTNLDGHQAEWSTLVGIAVYWVVFLLIVNFLHMLVSSPEEHEPWYRRITK